MSSTRQADAGRPARALIILVVVALTVLSALPGAASAANPAATLGVYAGGGAPAAVGAFESRLGRPVNQVQEFLPKESWSALTDPRWFIQRWTASRYAHRVSYSVPMLPDSGGTLAAGAAGTYNAHFRTLAAALVAGGEGSATLRLGWEFNGNWFRWSIGVPNGAANYAAYWRQIVRTMRSVPGASFKFDWCANNGSSYVGGKPLDAGSAYPGDAYVDYVGTDIYDQSWSAQRHDPAARWNEYLTRKNGLAWQRDFAAAHGKPTTFPEWGLGHRRDGYGGGDAPYFVERMYEWIRTNPVAYHDYFEFADASLDSALFGGKSPNAAKRFVALFGPSSTGAPLVAGSPPAAAAARRAPSAAKATKLSVTRARIRRRSRRLHLHAPITRLASGSARVELYAGGHRTSFAATIDDKRGQLRINRPISRRQARQGTGIVTINYGGNARTLPQEVRLRAAARAAKLTSRRPSIRGDRVVSSGTISKAARGVVRLQLVYGVDGHGVTRTFSAKVDNGRWRLDAALSQRIRDELERRSGSVHAYTLYTGYGPAGIGGEMTSRQLLGAR